MINVLDQFTDALGAPLRDYSKGRLAALLADPRPATWEDAHSVALNAQGLSYTSPEAVAQIAARQGLSNTDAEILSTYVVGLHCPDVR